MEAVKLPPGEDLNEWLAVNTVDFYNAVSILYATLEEFCTERTCEVMSAGGKVRVLSWGLSGKRTNTHVFTPTHARVWG